MLAPPRESLAAPPRRASQAATVLMRSIKRVGPFTKKTRRTPAAGQNGIEQPLIDRLLLNDKGIEQMIEGILQVDALKDPVGEMSDFSYRPTGIQMVKCAYLFIDCVFTSPSQRDRRCRQPLLKSGNACILRGGSEAFSLIKPLQPASRRASRGRSARDHGAAAQHHGSGCGGRIAENA